MQLVKAPYNKQFINRLYFEYDRVNIQLSTIYLFFTVNGIQETDE